MNRIDLINAAAAAAAVAAAVVVATLGSSDSPVTPAHPPRPDSPYVELDDGRQAVIDAAGRAVPVERYARVVSGSTVSDWLLVELSEFGRIRAMTERSARGAPWRHRFAGKDTIDTLTNLEALLALGPDLVVVDNLGDPRRIARLREHGLAVFDIGEMRGVDSVAGAARKLGALMGHPDPGAKLAHDFSRSMRAIAIDLPPEQRRSAVYVSVYGKQLYGGTAGTTYHDVLAHGGLIDAAAERYRGWPEYSPEALLELDPELIVTRRGMATALCRVPGLDGLRACSTPRGIVEIDGFILDDPGLGMREAAAAVYATVYGHSGDAPR